MESLSNIKLVESPGAQRTTIPVILLEYINIRLIARWYRAHTRYLIIVQHAYAWILWHLIRVGKNISKIQNTFKKNFGIGIHLIKILFNFYSITK